MNELREILLIHHTHTDIGYTHSQPVVWELHKHFIDRALDLCEETAAWPEPSRVRWTCEVTATLLQWLDGASARQIKRFRRLVAAGQISAGAMFCNLTPLYNADQLVRSLYPVRRLREELGLKLNTAINHDINGLPWPLTGFLRDVGVEAIIMGINPHFGGFPLHRPMVFDWLGPDGRPIRVFNAEHYSSFDRWLEPQFGSTDRMAAGLKRYLQVLQKQNYPHDFILLSSTHTDFVDNNPPNPFLANMVRQWNDEGRQPVIRFVTPEQITARLQALDPVLVEKHSGDWPDYWNFGCASSATETRINRRTKMRLNTAELLNALSPTTPPDYAVRSQQAWQAVQIYDEHTWGSWANTWNLTVDEVPAQFHFKAHEAYSARSWTGWVLRKQLEVLAGNPAEGTAPEGLLLVNPGPEKRRVMLTVPTRLATGHWVHHPGRVQNLEVPAAFLTEDEERQIGPFEVDAGSTAFIPSSDFRIVSNGETKPVVPGKLESDFYALEADPITGRIQRLVDKRLGRDLADPNSPWDLFGFVRERVDPARHQGKPKYRGRDALFETDFEKLSVELKSGWQSQWPALREKAGHPDKVTFRASPLGPQLTQFWQQAPGVRELTVAITLAEDRPAILLDVSFHKDEETWAESTYVSFPLRLNQWRAWYDVAGQVAAFNQEQLPGTVRDYATVGTWLAVADEAVSVTLACPDAPMVQVGGFQFGQTLAEIPSGPGCLVLGWPLNNYWDTNFPASQPGCKRFHYELTSSPEFDPAAAMRFGLAAATPVEYHPVLNASAFKSGPLVPKSNPAVLLTSLRYTLDGGGVLVHLCNPTESAQPVRLEFPFVWKTAFLSNALEESITMLPHQNTPNLELTVPARAHALVRLNLAPKTTKQP